VPADEIVKGYQYEKGKWVTLSDEDFQDVQKSSRRTRSRSRILWSRRRSRRSSFISRIS